MILAALALPVLIYFHISHITFSEALPSSIANFTVTVTGIEQKGNGAEILAETDISSGSAPLKIALLHNGKISINRGDRIFIHKTINKKELKAGGDKFNQYKLQGIYYTSYIIDNDITVISKNMPGVRDGLKNRFNENIDRLFRKDAAAMIKALFTGNRSSVARDVTIHFRDAGVLHILSASGLNVGIAAGLPFFLLLFNFRKRTVLFFSLFTVMIYLYITDMPISLVRAAVMFFIFAVHSFLYRKTNTFNALMITGGLIILILPWEIFSIGFQLSFGATLGIILFYGSYKKSLGKFPSYLKKSMALSLSAQVFTVPLIIYHLHQLNTISILSNIVIIPVATALMYISFTALALSAVINSASGMASIITLYGYKALVKSVEFFSDFNFNFFLNDNYPVVLVFIGLSLIPLIPARTTAKMKAFPVILALVLCTVYLKVPAESNPVEVTIVSGTSSALLDNRAIPELSLDIHDSGDAEIILNKIRTMNIEIKIVKLQNGSIPNLLACKRVCTDFLIDECRFSVLPDFSSIFKNLICSLEADNISVTFTAD